MSKNIIKKTDKKETDNRLTVKMGEMFPDVFKPLPKKKQTPKKQGFSFWLFDFNFKICYNKYMIKKVWVGLNSYKGIKYEFRYFWYSTS